MNLTNSISVINVDTTVLELEDIETKDSLGTAIITSAALINASNLVNKKIENMKIVISSIGSTAIICAKMYKKLGAKNIIMCDFKEVIKKKQNDLKKSKKHFIIEIEDITIENLMTNADMFLGLNNNITELITKELIISMAPNPIILLLSNIIPNKEILKVRDDIIIGTNKSDYPNQIDNTLVFPFLFKGVSDVQASRITENMKMAAAIALAKLAKQPIPDYVKKIYNNEDLEYGKEHIIPKPLNKDVLIWVTAAVAEAAIEDGVANIKIFNLEQYQRKLKKMIV